VGLVPESFKAVHVTPLPKKPDLDAAIQRSHQPISQLPVQSKALERLVARQLIDHMKTNNRLPFLQSPNRPIKPTQTSVIKVHFVLTVEAGDLTPIALPDQSIAFDTTGHHAILQWPRISFTFSCPVLAW
jgi:hypothetical protein